LSLKRQIMFGTVMQPYEKSTANYGLVRMKHF